MKLRVQKIMIIVGLLFSTLSAQASLNCYAESIRTGQAKDLTGETSNPELWMISTDLEGFDVFVATDDQGRTVSASIAQRDLDYVSDVQSAKVSKGGPQLIMNLILKDEGIKLICSH